jgi:hypothetical protein
VGRWETPHPEIIFREQKNMTLSLYAQIDINRFKGNEFIQLNVSSIIL